LTYLIFFLIFLINPFFYKLLADFKWYQPPNQKSGNEPKNSESKIGAPEPRANCSATYHKNKVYIFGGHGGINYQRVSFNDFYVFDCETSEWMKIENIEGNAPFPRGGHSAALLANDDKIIIFGGWSSSTQFADLWIYDIINNCWVETEVTHEIPRWYHCGLIVPGSLSI